MDMHGMDMGGMDMGGAAMFQVTNMKIAKRFWYVVAAVVGVCALKRICDVLRTHHANTKFNTRNATPSRPTNIFSQSYDTVVTISRELAYPQLRPFTGPVARYFNIVPLGQALLLLAYWTMILIMLWSNVILTPSSDLYGYKWEIVGFRAAWVSVAQLPLIYCLGGKANIISLITGISYERLNWLHRWIARTIFLTVIVHWSYFFREWWLADFIQDEFEMMPMVKYGFGAWAVMGWSVITGFGFFRTKTYELWLLQHLASVGVLLWLLYIHVPAYAQYNVWLSVAFMAFDRGIRGAWSLIRNLHIKSLWQKLSGNRSLMGFHAKVKSHADGYLSMIIENPDLTWQPGQHVFISMPACGIFESHPFTIANGSGTDNKSLELYCKSHSGFTGRLRRRAEAGKADNMLTFISGPWGNPPTAKIERCNSLVFVASSTGVAFTLPLLEHAIRKAKFVQRVHFHWIIRHDSQLETFLPRITAALQSAHNLNIEAQCHVFVTDESNISPLRGSYVDVRDVRDGNMSNGLPATEQIPNSGTLSDKQSVQPETEKLRPVTVRSASSTSQTASITSGSTSEKQYRKGSHVTVSSGRPASWDDLLHPVIVEAEGETLIVACGGLALMADIRNYIAWISDQRAVHKGTGAQGIALYTETYGW